MSKPTVALSILIVATSLSACGGGTITDAFGPDIPPQTQPVPESYPNVFTEVRRADSLKTDAEKDAEIEALRSAGNSHVGQAVRAIETR